MDKFNYTMLCDFYELTMGNGYFVSGMQEKISYFDLFFRQIPGVFSDVMAGALIIVSFYPVSRPPAFQIRRIIIIRLYTAEDKSLSARFRSIVHVAFRKINSQ